MVVYITGNGLKTQEAVADKVLKPLYIKPTLSAFEDAMAKREGVVAGVA